MEGILFEVNEEEIAQVVTGLSTEGRKWKRTSHVENSEILNWFFHGNEALVKLQGGYESEELPGH